MFVRLPFFSMWNVEIKNQLLEIKPFYPFWLSFSTKRNAEVEKVIWCIFCFLPLSAYEKSKTQKFNIFSCLNKSLSNSHFLLCRTWKEETPKSKFFQTLTPEFWVLRLHLSHMFMLDPWLRFVFLLRFGIFSLTEFVRFLPFLPTFLLYLDIFTTYFSRSSSQFLWFSNFLLVS